MNNFPLAKRLSFILWFFLMGVPGPAFAGVDDASGQGSDRQWRQCKRGQ
jgi:hypothetical protein